MLFRSGPKDTTPALFAFRRVILLRSGIWLSPSGIRFASLRANRISPKPQGFSITIAQAIISLFAKAKNITKKQRRESFTEFCNRVTLSSVLSQVSHLFNKCFGLCPYPYFISPLRTSPIPHRLFLFHFSFITSRTAPCKTPRKCQGEGFPAHGTAFDGSEREPSGSA